MDNYWDRPKCQCKDCGKTFRKGEEGDNEEYCLRCCAISEADYDGEYGDDHE